MPHNKNTDRVVRRILPWIALLSTIGLIVYLFYPHANDYGDETPYHTLGQNTDQNNNNDDEDIDTQDLELDPDLILNTRGTFPEEQNSDTYPTDEDIAKRDSTTPVGQVSQQAQKTTQISSQKNGQKKKDTAKGFVKFIRHFDHARNYWDAINKSNLNTTLIAQLAPLRGHLDNDDLTSVDILYTNYYQNGTFNPHNSRILMVRGNTRQGSWAYYALGRRGKIQFYDEKGNAPELSMDRTPFNYLRISSPFNLHRRHPITGRIMPHEGVDLVQAYGYPVHATGDGVVTFAGIQHGYGRIVIIHHPNDYETRYAHLSTIAVKQGESVKRGEIVGKLGSSGMATGPHTHYEVRIDGIPHDPMTVKLPSFPPLAHRYLRAWHDRTAQYQHMLDTLLPKKH